MDRLYIVLVVFAVLYLVAFARTQQMSLSSFVPKAQVKSRAVLNDADGLGSIERAVNHQPGLRVLDKTDDALLISASPTFSSMDRGFGIFIRASVRDSAMELAGQGKLFMGLGGRLQSALQGVERELRHQLDGA